MSIYDQLKDEHKEALRSYGNKYPNSYGDLIVELEKHTSVRFLPVWAMSDLFSVCYQPQDRYPEALLQFYEMFNK